MLAIRLQRRGRKGDAFYRIVVQEARRSPSSGRLVRQIGTFNPHTKETTLNKDDAKFFLDNGAQPSTRAATLLKKEGVKLPKWVEIKKNDKREIRNPEKLRKNQPKDAKPSAEAEQDSSAEEAPAEEKTTVEPNAEQSAQKPAEEAVETAPAEEKTQEPKEEKANSEPEEKK